jgi:hypothetical protein
MLILDAGAFVAVERGDREVVALVKRERLAGRDGRQVPVARLLAGTDVTPIDSELGRRV